MSGRNYRFAAIGSRPLPAAICWRGSRLQFDQAVADVFGYHALQLGLAEVDALAANRMPHRWLATGRSRMRAARAALRHRLRGAAASSPTASIWWCLPHTLEFSADPHATLREVERVLVPEGQVVICGFNPASLWGLRQRRAQLYRRLGFGELYLPDGGDFIGYRRMRDWLRLLGFEVESGRFGIYRPAVRSERWLERCRWLDRAGERWWPIFGAVYFLVAVKRVRGMRLLTADWRRKPALAAAPVPIAGRLRRRAE